jgi:hypothetical protein
LNTASDEGPRLGWLAQPANSCSVPSVSWRRTPRCDRLDHPPGLLGALGEQLPQVAQRARLQADVVQRRHLLGQPLAGRETVRLLERDGELPASADSRFCSASPKGRCGARCRCSTPSSASPALTGTAASAVGSAATEPSGRSERIAQRSSSGGASGAGSPPAPPLERAAVLDAVERDVEALEVLLQPRDRQRQERAAAGRGRHVARELAEALEARAVLAFCSKISRS